jgi:hypothetical protein
MNNTGKTPRQHYYQQYDSVVRFISYYYQCKTVMDLQPQSVLEIGIGNKSVSNYLKERGIFVTTCDYNEELRPDYITDIRDLSCFQDNSFDVVMACEILEHLPWEDIDHVLQDFQRITKKYVVISLPWSGGYINLAITFPYIRNWFHKDYINVGFRIPRFFGKVKSKGEHYWEIGVKDYPLSKIKSTLGSYLKLDKDISHGMDRYHHYFVLSK